MSIVKQYKNYIIDYPKLNNRFKKLKITNKWEQVLTSRSTGLYGTGVTYSSVSADYKLNLNGSISLTNMAYDTNFKPVFVNGISKARDPNVPTCRTVEFNNRSGAKGNYWIVYISDDLSTFIVGAPLIIFNKLIIPNTGLYVLTLNRDKFWKNNNLQQEIFAILKKYGYTNFFNKPIFSGFSKPNSKNGISV